MQDVRKTIGGLGNLMFKQAYLMGQVLDGKLRDVYVQDFHLWEKHAYAIKAAFNTGIGKTDKVALHIRRGDYLQAQYFHKNLWESDYYQKAVNLFPTDTQFLVFCKDNQDPEQDKADRIWCRENLPKLGIKFEMAPYEDTEVEDLNLMASCKSIIMANSSFSWWAAFLGEHDMVICPEQWFVDGVQRTALLEDWIKL